MAKGNFSVRNRTAATARIPIEIQILVTLGGVEADSAANTLGEININKAVITNKNSVFTDRNDRNRKRIDKPSLFYF